MKTSENIRNRIDLLNQIQPFVGTYFSKDYIMKNILRMTENEVQQMNTQIEQEPPPQPIVPDQNPGQ
jgi:hypothetical protein